MKKYKLIKQYPGSPELGSIFQMYEGYKGDYHKQPEFWQEIVEKKYEILSFQATTPDKTIYRKNVAHLFSTPMTNMLPLEKCLLDKNLIIHSIKRLTDNEIFTIGDETQEGIIEFIELTKDDLFFRTAKTWHYLDMIKKKLVEQILFTTIENIKITTGFKGQLHIINQENFELKSGLIYDMVDFVKTYAHDKYLIFHNFAKAKEYIIRNKPCLSLKEISQIYISANSYNPVNTKPQGQSEKLYKFVQTKLKL